MPMIEFDQKSLLRGKIVTPAWYRVRIESAGTKPSKDGGSTNYPMEGVIIRNAEDGSEEFAGVPLDWNFNSKAIGFAVGFFNAFGMTPETGKRYELNHAVGKELEIFVENDTYNGNAVNRVNHKYRQLREDVENAPA
jgi:hypothetical protein